MAPLTCDGTQRKDARPDAASELTPGATADAMVVRVWDGTQAARGRVHNVLSALASFGLNSYASTALTEPGSTLLLLDRITPEYLDLVETLGHGGIDRVFVLWLAEAPLSRADRWALLSRDAADALVWHDRGDAEHVVRRFARWHAVDALLASPLVANNLVGNSIAWMRTLRELVEIGRFSDASVLITGETGTGKELAAKLIHTLDTRKGKKDLVVLDCTTVVPTLSGSEFFGHEKGAFTGAGHAREGVFSIANGGTLFLDEIGELPLALQAEVLRALQEGAYKPVGSNAWRHTDFRLVCATHRDLSADQDDGAFRTDLFHRLSSFQVELPSLAQRRSDIMPLFFHFASAAGMPLEGVDEAVEEFLLTRDFPGNIRELRQLAIQMCHRHTGCGPLTVGAIPRGERKRDAVPGWSRAGFGEAIERAVGMGIGLKGLRRAAEDAAVDYAIALEGGSLQRAAARLGVTARAIQLRVAGKRQELTGGETAAEPLDTSQMS